MCAGQARIDGRPVTEHLLLALLLGLTLLPYVSANGNSTAEPDTKSVPCPEYTENCTEISSPSKWRSHFSRCPKTYRHYCVKGKCRYVSAEKTPACICESGYTGSRCEYLDLFYLKGDRGQLVVIGMIAAMVTLIVLIISLCICSHHCRRLRRRKMKAKVIDTMDNDCAVPIEETQLA
uniref:Probetacellulin n=1 Tax=Leptobrachium leishanense TaxID=445787 RepID=A0A8C5N324_9ANUR